jgi:hypothetical protein
LACLFGGKKMQQKHPSRALRQTYLAPGKHRRRHKKEKVIGIELLKTLTPPSPAGSLQADGDGQSSPGP